MLLAFFLENQSAFVSARVDEKGALGLALGGALADERAGYGILGRRSVSSDGVTVQDPFKLKRPMDSNVLGQ